MNTRITAKFLGGVAYGEGNLTGSSILLIVEQGKRTSRILIDAGLVQCYKDSLPRNLGILGWLKPERLNAIILTHAHIDHIGRLPLLVKHGFRGRIFCTEATRGLIPVMLEDSARIQMTEALHLRAKSKNSQEKGKDHNHSRDLMTRGSYDKRKKHDREQQPGFTPLYTLEDVEATCDLVKNDGFAYREWIRLDKDIYLQFYPSGHVLGGAICVLRLETPRGNRYLGFSGDLGREDGIILPPPEMVQEPLDGWFTESTYGGKQHPERIQEIEKLLELIRDAKSNGRKMIIPSFALERAQEIIYLLSYHMQQGDIPQLPIYLDSPMAQQITRIFAHNWEKGMFQGQEKLKINPFLSEEEGGLIRTVSDEKASEALAAKPGPHIIIAASGMCDAGRVRTHLRAGLGSPQTIVAIIGYMSENSLGRKLKDKLPIVRMNGTEIVVKARVESFDSFSAHADGDHLVRYARQLLEKATNEHCRIFLIHGEEEGATAMKMDLMEKLPKDGWQERIIIRKLGEERILL